MQVGLVDGRIEQEVVRDEDVVADPLGGEVALGLGEITLEGRRTVEDGHHVAVVATVKRH